MMMKNLPRNFFICTTRYIYWIHCFFLHKYGHIMRLPRLPSGKESACQYSRHRRCRFDPWVRRIPGSRSWHPTPVFLPGEFHGQRSLAGYSPLCTSFANFFFFFNLIYLYFFHVNIASSIWWGNHIHYMEGPWCN